MELRVILSINALIFYNKSSSGHLYLIVSTSDIPWHHGVEYVQLHVLCHFSFSHAVCMNG